MNLQPLNFFFLSSFRGRPHPPPGGRHQVPLVLAHPGVRGQGGGQGGPLPGPGHPAAEADPQHGRHDGHLRADGLRHDQEDEAGSEPVID